MSDAPVPHEHRRAGEVRAETPSTQKSLPPRAYESSVGNSIGYNENDYIFLLNEHKKPMVNGPTAGWNLALRKKDNCLLVIEATSKSRDAPEEIREISHLSSRRFFLEPEKIKTRLLDELTRQGVSSEKGESIYQHRYDCPLGYRDLEEP